MKLVRSVVLVAGESVLLAFLLLSLLSVGYAEVRSSSNYQLQSDSLNFGGGFSTSTTYVNESTFGEVATGEGESTSYKLQAGYQQMQEVFLSMTQPANVTMSPSLGGLTGGFSLGSTSVSVATDSPAGYELVIEAENSPAMQGVLEDITDYVPVDNPNPDFIFTTATTDVHFGFSPEGDDIPGRFLDNGSDCAVGSSDTGLACWDGLSTTAKVIATGPTNHPVGATTTIQFRLEIGSEATVLAGQYIATTTLTAVPL